MGIDLSVAGCKWMKSGFDGFIHTGNVIIARACYGMDCKQGRAAWRERTAHSHSDLRTQRYDIPCARLVSNRY